MNQIEIEFESALATARQALVRFNEEQMVASQRGGPRTSPWFRCWKEASEVAQRWARLMESVLFGVRATNWMAHGAAVAAMV